MRRRSPARRSEQATPGEPARGGTPTPGAGETSSAVFQVDGHRVRVELRGRVENVSTLAGQLAALGYRNALRTSAEVVLCAYLQWGAAATWRIAAGAVVTVWDGRYGSVLVGGRPNPDAANRGRGGSAARVG